MKLISNSGRVIFEADTNSIKELLIQAFKSGANLSYTNLSGANLSGAKNLFMGEFLKQFEMTDKGMIVYKSFGDQYTPPASWKIKRNAVIRENWVKRNTGSLEIWKCLIPIHALWTITVPYNTDGKFRCGEVKLLSVVK